MPSQASLMKRNRNTPNFSLIQLKSYGDRVEESEQKQRKPEPVKERKKDV
jgi:hypothetical protein